MIDVNGTYKVDTNSVNKKQTISDNGIKNFLSAVCGIVVYNLKHKKNFGAIEFENYHSCTIK